MTLPLTGSLSFNNVNVELIRTPTNLLSLNDYDVRTLAGKLSGIIGMSDLRGKFWAFRLTIASNQANLDLRTAALAAGWDGSLLVEATINSGVYIYSTESGDLTPALTINGSWPGGLRIINKGYIVGRGGAGGTGAIGANFAVGNAAAGAGAIGSKGGRALLVSSACTIDNTLGTIAGGGGGGGGGGGVLLYLGSTKYVGIGGHGGGGGRSGITTSLGGSAGSTNLFVSGTYSSTLVLTSGTAGSTTSAGVSGTSTGTRITYNTTGASASISTVLVPGGSGASYGISGESAPLASINSYSFSGLTYMLVNGGVGGATGTAVTGNSLITWIATGSRLGTIIA